jgi:hypothetical protein
MAALASTYSAHVFSIAHDAMAARNSRKNRNNHQNRQSKTPQFRRSGRRAGVAIFRRSASTLGDRCWSWRGDDGFGADVFRHEFGMLSESITGTFDLHDDSVMEQSVEQRRGDDGIAEYVAPFSEATVRGEDHRPALIARVDELEEQIAAAVDDGQIADLIDDQQRGAAEEPDALLQTAFALRPSQMAEQIGQCAEVDAAPGFHRLDTKRYGEMAFSGAGRTEEVYDLAARDKAQLRERQDAVAIQ